MKATSEKVAKVKSFGKIMVIMWHQIYGSTLHKNSSETETQWIFNQNCKMMNQLCKKSWNHFLCAQKMMKKCEDDDGDDET